MSTSIPALPSEFLSSDDPFVGIMRPTFVGLVDKLNDLSGTYETVREADASAESALENSEIQEASDYRDLNEEATAKLDEIADEIAAEIKAVKERHAARQKAIKEAVSEARKAALAAVVGDTLSGVDLNSLQEEYTQSFAALKKLVPAVKDSAPYMIDWAKSLPSPTKQAQGSNGGGERGARGWTPRFVSITVDGTEISPPTLGGVAKHLNLKGAGARGYLVDRLKTVTIREFVPTDSETTFTANDSANVSHTVTVVGKVAASTEEEVTEAA